MILIVLFILLLFTIVYYILLRKKFHRPKPFVPHNKAIWLLGGYGTLLVLGVIFYAFIPAENNRADAEKIIENQRYSLYERLANGKFDEIEPKFRMEKWEKPYTDTKLNIGLGSITIDDGNQIDVFVERKRGNDGRIEAYLFQSKSYLEDVDITKYVKPFDLDWHGIDLRITAPDPEYKNIKFVIADREFPAKQFSKKPLLSHQADIILGEQYLYFRVPKDLIIENQAKDTINIEYVK